jgi:tetratricopeptide (TPR) repeat protein
MMSRLRRTLALGIVIAAMAGSALAKEPREGLVVIEAPPTGSVAEAGLRPGDTLLSWQRGDASGLLRWPSGLAEAEIEQAPWGVVRLTGWRGDRPMTWQMPAVRWSVRTRPALSPHLLALYQEGTERAAAQDLAGAADAWLRAVDAAARMDDRQRASWFLGELGRVQAAASQWEPADQAYDDAIRRVEGSAMAAYLLREWGGWFVRRELWRRAEDCYQRALALAPPGSLAAGRDLALLASIATHRGDLDEAESLYKQALATRRRVTVTSSYLTHMIREEIAGFGTPDERGTREEIAEIRQKLQHLRETLLAQAGVPPKAGGSTKTAAAAAPPKKPEPNPLEALKKALSKAEREAPGSLAVSDLWQELGELAWGNKDRVAAEVAWLRALDLREKLAPGTFREARTLHDLGWVHASAQRDRAAASFFCRASAALDQMGHLSPIDNAASDALAAWPAAYDEDCVNALVAAHRTDEAFLALERSHLRGAAPPLSAGLIRQTRQIDTDRSQALTRLARLSTSRDRDEVDSLGDYAEELASQRRAISGPRDLDALRAALPPGALLLAWSIGDRQSFVFLVRPAEATGPGIEVVPIRAHASDLRETIRSYTKDLGKARWTARDLYRQLFEPVDEQVARAERLLLLPGEILAPLRFESLVRGDTSLAQQKPLQTATSVTAWVALQKVLQDTRGTKNTASP